MVVLRRFLNQQRAAERKKELFEQMRASLGAKKPQPAATPPDGPAEASAPGAVAASKANEDSLPELEVERLDSPLSLYRDPDYVPVSVMPATAELVDLALRVAKAKRRVAVLRWPGTMRNLPLVHALATIRRWRIGDKKGIRTLLYPANANTFNALNHIHFDRRGIAGLASRLVDSTPPSPPNPLVTRSFRAKDPFLTALNNIGYEDADPFHPTIAELTPLFYADQAFTGWETCAGSLLRHVKGRLERRAHRAALATLSVPTIGDPSTAPDALFAIGYRTPRDDFVRALSALRAKGAPDLVIVDATRAIRRSIPGWRGALSRFIETVHLIFGIDACGVMLVVDEPWVVSHILRELEKNAEKSKRDRLKPNDYCIVGVLCTANSDGVSDTSSSVPVAPKPLAFDVILTDTHASNVIGQLQQLKNRLSSGHPAERPLTEAVSFLSRLAALPAGPKTVMAWLDESGAPSNVRDAYTWMHYRAELYTIANEPGFEEKISLLGILAKVDRLWENYQNGTPFARALAELIEVHTRGSEKCCVVFTRPTARRLAERYFESYDGYPEGAGFEVLRDCVRFIVTADLQDELETLGTKTFVFAGLDEESLRIILTEDRLSAPTFVLMTQRNAGYLSALLRSVRHLPAFAPLYGRIDALQSKLRAADVDDRTVFVRDDFVLPAFSFEMGLAASVADAGDATDPTAWRVVLEGGTVLYKGGGAAVFAYDPAHPRATHHGYRAVEVSKLQPGTRIFVMSGELRELLENALKEAGIPIERDRRFEDALENYHQRVIEQTDKLFPAGSLSEQARVLREAMRAKPDCPDDLPLEQTVRSWIDLRKFEGLEFEKKKPHAPKIEAHFKVFADALQIMREEAIWFWRRVIQPLRGTRRADGRQISDVYTRMLLEPESVEVHNRLRPGLVRELFARARDNVYVVENVMPPASEGSE
jgi:hypothetical protein